MRDAQSKEIDGTTYKIYPMSPTKGSVWVKNLLGIIGPSLALCGGGEKLDLKELLKLQVKGEDLSKGLSLFFEKIKDEDFLRLQRDVLLNGLVTFSVEGGDYKKIESIDTHFAKYKGSHLMKVLMFALEVNFKDFLPALDD